MLLEVDRLSVGFGPLAVTENISFAIERGQRFGLIGESGSGKSVTALAIAGLLPEGAWTTGTVRLDGAELPRNDREMARLRGKRIGFVFQEPMTALNPLMRIGRQVAEAMAPFAPGAASGPGLDSLFAEVGLDPEIRRRYPHQVSGGQRQRAVIAMALANKPDLLIADEPTSALDSITQKRILELIEDVCRRRGTALLFISHDLRAVASLCSRVLVLQAGRNVETGLTEEVFRRPQAPYTKALVGASIVPARADAAARPHGPELLRVQTISRRFRVPGLFPFRRAADIAAVDAVSFSVAAGESVALVGPSGSGKSTVARIVVGLDRADAGDVLLEGRPYGRTGLPKSLRRDISLVFQDPFGSLDPRMTVGDSIGEPLRLLGALPAAARFQKIADSLVAVGLPPAVAERYPHEFSGGQRQRLAIARALVTRPRLVVLDEPVSALDMSVRNEVLALLARLQGEFGLSYLLISHDLDMVRAIADRVLIMGAGRIVEGGTPADLFDDPQHPLTRELVAARLPALG